MWLPVRNWFRQKIVGTDTCNWYKWGRGKIRQPELPPLPKSTSRNLEESFETGSRDSCWISVPLQCKFTGLIIGIEEKKVVLVSGTEAHRGMEPLPVHLRRIMWRHEAVGISCHPSLSHSSSPELFWFWHKPDSSMFFRSDLRTVTLPKL